jgi:hypothetical protein
VALAISAVAGGQEADEAVVRLRATADVGLSDASPRDRHAGDGKARLLKLRSIQDLALVRFDAAPLAGREVLEATLYLHCADGEGLRYLRVSTVNQDWEEGSQRVAYGPPDGATFLMANAAPRGLRPWAWAGSTVADVIMSSGNSLGSWGQRREYRDGWIGVRVAPALVYALAAGDSDGLAVMEGGNPAMTSHYVSSAQDPGYEPVLEVRLGRPLTIAPAAPRFAAEPAFDRAGLDRGAIRLSIEPADHVFCWRVRLDGQPVARWRVKHPAPGGTTEFCLEDLEPARPYEIEIVAVSPGGIASPPARLTAMSSPSLPRRLALGPFEPMPRKRAEVKADGTLRVWPVPGLVKISPVDGKPVDDQPASEHADAREGETNAVWDGTSICLFGARGETVSYQLVIANAGRQPLRGIAVRPQPLFGPDGARIDRANVEVFRNWYARNRHGTWQPAYGIPMESGEAFTIPSVDGRVPGQRNQTVYVDLYIPKSAKPGRYGGVVAVASEDGAEVELPVRLEVFDFALPDRLSFWPELNAFRVPENAHAYYRLAHEHRCVLNCFAWRPRLVGSGRSVVVEWDEYDRWVGPLLTGEAFADCRRAGAPVECMYLPFDDSWPTPLSPETYRYHGPWPRQGDPMEHVTAHYVNGPFIADGLTPEYQEAFLAVQRQFIEHFEKRGYSQTEMQCFFGNKAAHRVLYGVNVWWTTDEPYHWDDWLALQYFLHLWTRGRGEADPRLWAARADISRPQWQGRTLNGIVDAVYYGAGGFTGPAMTRRCRTLARETGLNVRCYGSTAPDTSANIRNVGALVAAWLDGADAYLPWQTLGTDRALDDGDAGAEGGAALLVPGDRFGLPVVADLQVKALRDGQQLIEYLTLLSERRRVSREEIRAAIEAALGEDSPSDLSRLTAWQLAELRRRVAAWLAK